MKKRIFIAAILALCAVIAFCACGNTPEATTEASTAPVATDAEYTQSPEIITVENGLEYKSNADGGCTVVRASTELTGDIVIPSEHDGLAVTAIGDEAFDSCAGITSVKLPAGVKTIGQFAFSHCSSLESVTLGKETARIGDFAFFACTSLKSFCVPAENATFVSSGGAIYSVFGDLVAVPATTAGEFTVDNGTYEIAPCAFISCSRITKIVLPETVEEIGDYAFDGCSALTELTLPDSVTAIGEYAFSFCASLEKLAVPAGVAKISDGAFWCCDALKEITLPAGVTEIGEDAFYDCVSLEKIIFGGTLSEWESVEKRDGWNTGTDLTVICSDVAPEE